MNSVLPTLSKAVKDGGEKVTRILQLSFDFLFLLGAPMAVGLFLLAYPIIFLITQPEIEEAEIDIKDEDIHWDVFRAGGAGGQSVNTADSAVRLTHKPSGVVVTCQNERSQLQNKQKAMQNLKAKLVALQEKHHLATVEEIRGEHTQHSWGNQIRSYVLHPYQMVKDHRTNHETSQVDNVLNGDLDEFIEASLRAN